MPGERLSGFPLHTLIAANTVSLVGNVLATVAVPWFVLETTGSAAKTGIAAFFTTLPLALGALFGGTVADRLEFWHLVVLVFATSLFDAPGQAAREALVPELAARSGRTLERATSSCACPSTRRR